MEPEELNTVRPPWDISPKNLRKTLEPDVIIRRTAGGYDIHIPHAGAAPRGPMAPGRSNRQDTLRLITLRVIENQIEFLQSGSQLSIRPLTRTRLAEMIGVHESTVSRATAEKYVQLPNEQIVPFDVFFSPSLAIKAAIEEIICDEDPENPHSDREIMQALKARGLHVARRTIVKYREEQKLLSSNRRRR